MAHSATGSAVYPQELYNFSSFHLKILKTSNRNFIFVELLWNPGNLPVFMEVLWLVCSPICMDSICSGVPRLSENTGLTCSRFS